MRLCLAVGQILLATAAPGESPPPASITGTVTYRERLALPPDAELLIRLEDTSRAGAHSEVIAEGSARIPHQVPLSFELPFDPAAIKPGNRYQISATIVHKGKTLFVTDTAHYVLTRGAPARVDIVLRKLAAEPPATPKR